MEMDSHAIFHPEANAHRAHCIYLMKLYKGLFDITSIVTSPVSCMRLRRQFDITLIVASMSHVCDCDDNSISLQLSHPCLMFVTATTIGILSDNIEDPVLRQMMREEEEQKARELRIKVGRCRC